MHTEGFRRYSTIKDPTPVKLGLLISFNPLLDYVAPYLSILY